MFVSIPDKTSAKGLTYEISNIDWTVRSISKKGVRKTINPDEYGRVRLAGKRYMVYDLAKLVDLPPKEWPEDKREWEELQDADTAHGLRYRMFVDGAGQSMDQHGKIVDMTATWNPSGYYTMMIYGGTKVHNLMGLTRFVPKPSNMPPDWTVDHGDKDPGNNHADNLEWKSPSDQAKNRRPTEQPRIVSYAVIGTALRDLVLVDGYVVLEGENVYFDTADLSVGAIVGGNSSKISRCVCGIQNSHAGFLWKTPLSDGEYPDELFESIGANVWYERSLSNAGRVKFEFHHGYSKIVMAAEMTTKRQRRETDEYPRIRVGGKNVRIHVKIVESFVGTFPKKIEIGDRDHKLVVDHIDDVKSNSRLGNLQLLTHQDNSQKRFLKSYTTSVASFVDGKFEKAHNTRAAATESVKGEYPDATLEELNAAIELMTAGDVPAKLYGRSWIRSRFETTQRFDK
jgi:hypothetical protein